MTWLSAAKFRISQQGILEWGREIDMLRRYLLALVMFPCAVAAQGPGRAPNVLPAAAVTQLASSLKAAAAHPRHVWRDTAPTNPDGTVNG